MMGIQRQVESDLNEAAVKSKDGPGALLVKQSIDGAVGKSRQRQAKRRVTPPMAKKEGWSSN